MHFLTNSLFFILDDFAHASLWQEGEPVWSALHNLKKYLLKQKLGNIQIDIPAGVHLVNPELISIGSGTVIEPGVMIKGPCIIGDRCMIAHGAYIRSNVILGNECVIGHSAELKHSILFNKARVTHFTYIGDSIIGNRANLAAGVKCANLRLDKAEVTVRFENTEVNSGLRKFGAIIGDDVQIGCNCVLNPGTILGKESVCYPLLNISGFIPPRSSVRSTREIQIEKLATNV
jgi:NDP-sugar pyrophosphorylase family protein